MKGAFILKVFLSSTQTRSYFPLQHTHSFYWLLYVTWSKSPDSFNAITPAHVDICLLFVSVEEKQSAQEFQLFFPSVNMEGNQTRFNECSESDISFYSAFLNNEI